MAGWSDPGERARDEAVRIIVLSERNAHCFGAALRQYKQRHGLTLLEMRQRLRTSADPLSLEGYATLAAQPLPAHATEIEALVHGLALTAVTVDSVLGEFGLQVTPSTSVSSDSAF